MSARQQHGFDYEQHIFNNYSITPTTGYSHRWDGIHASGSPVSIKTSRVGTSVEFGSLMRNAELDESFILIIGFWDGRGGQRIIASEHAYQITPDLWNDLFPLTLCESMMSVFDGISNSCSDDARWREQSRKYQRRWRDSGVPTSVHFKRDHKSQRRIQCSVPYHLLSTVFLSYEIDLESLK